MSARSLLADARARLAREGASDRLLALLSGARFGKFVSTGAIGAAFDITTLLVLTELLGVPAAVANVLSIETAILVMFLINETWTFADEGGESQRSITTRLVRSHLVRALGSTLQWLVFVAVFYNVAVTIQVAGVDLWLVMVKAGAIGVAMLLNYVFETLFTWRVHAE